MRLKNLIQMLNCILLINVSYGQIKNGKHHLFLNAQDNEIKCKVQSLCDIALVKGDSFVNWIITDGGPWVESARRKTTFVDNEGRTHIILQPTYALANNPVILVGTENQYRFNLSAVDNNKINNYVFEISKKDKYNSANVDKGLDIDFKQIKAEDKYIIDGDIGSEIRPLAVFNDGKKTYIQMNKNIRVSELPTVYIYDKDKKLQIIPGVRYRQPFFIIDGIKPSYTLIIGSKGNNDLIQVNIKKKDNK